MFCFFRWRVIGPDTKKHIIVTPIIIIDIIIQEMFLKRQISVWPVCVCVYDKKQRVSEFVSGCFCLCLWPSISVKTGYPL